MRIEHLGFLSSPGARKPLRLLETDMDGDRVRSGRLTDGDREWPIIDYIPRFVPPEGHWDSFSFQWRKHPRLLSQTHSGLTLYRERFNKETRWPADLRGQTVIEAGCGSGGFTRFALETGATVLSFDVSKSVDVSYRENRHENLLVVQASLFEMPFVAADRIYCFGVLQHTPDPRAALHSLTRKLKPGGHLATDIYARVPLTGLGPYNLLKTKYLLRRWTPIMDKERLHHTIERYVNLMWAPCTALQRWRRGKLLSQLLLIDDYRTRMTGMDPGLLREFAVLDIFDMLSPTYDLPATLEDFRSWHEEVGLREIDVHFGYNGLEGRAVAPG